MTTKRPRDGGASKLLSTEIVTIIKDIRAISGTEKQRQDTGAKRYPEFAEHYPHLFKLACEPAFDMSRLEYMLNLRDSVNNQKVTFEDASKEVGQVMFDTYIKDKIDMNMYTKPPQQ
jgi:hypothetical protein